MNGNRYRLFITETSRTWATWEVQAWCEEETPFGDTPAFSWLELSLGGAKPPKALADALDAWARVVGQIADFDTRFTEN